MHSIWIDRKMKALLFEKGKRRGKRIGCVVPPVCEVVPPLRDFSVNVVLCIVFV